MRRDFIEALTVAAKVDPKILLITGDLGYEVLDNFELEVPNQFVNAGIAEQSMMSLAAGYASMGHRVFVYSIGNFPTLRCLEQIRNDVCYMQNSVNIVSVGAGYSYGPQGYSHHALEDISVMRALPNLEILSPMDSIDAVRVVEYLTKRNGASYVRLGKDNEKELLHPIRIKEDVCKFAELRVGSDATLLFTGNIGHLALDASKILLNLGISVAVTGCTNISNLDAEYLIQAAAKGPVITLEEHAYAGGFGSRILEWYVLKQNSTPKMSLIAGRTEDLRQIGSQKYLLEINGLSVRRIVSEVRKLVPLIKENNG